jgi:hypothetical protein
MNLATCRPTARSVFSSRMTWRARQAAHESRVASDRVSHASRRGGFGGSTTLTISEQ